MQSTTRPDPIDHSGHISTGWAQWDISEAARLPTEQRLMIAAAVEHAEAPDGR